MTHKHPSLAEAPGRVFVGRKVELAELTAVLEHGLGGRGRLVLLVGEPGIGKTHLASEFAVRQRRQHWFQRCRVPGSAPRPASRARAST